MTQISQAPAEQACEAALVASDDDIRDGVYEALESRGPIETTSLPLISVEVDHGLVTLRGNIAARTLKDLAVTAASPVHGVKAVKNELVADDELLEQLVTIFGAHGETDVVHGPVETFLGIVTLSGRSGAGSYEAMAPGLALGVPGVRAVLDQLDIPAELREAERSAVEVTFGRKIICQGQEVGTVDYALADSGLRQTRAIVSEAGHFPAQWTVLLVAACTQADERYLYLDLSLDELAKLPAYADPDLHEPFEGSGPFHEEEGAQSTRLRPQTRVMNGKDHLATLIGLRFDHLNGGLTHLNIRMAEIEAINGWVPTTVCWSEAEGIATSLSKAQLEQLCQAVGPRPEAELQDDIHARLLAVNWQQPPAGIIRAEVDQGCVSLSGCVRTASNRLAAEAAIHGLPGVIAVSNEIVVET